MKLQQFLSKFYKNKEDDKENSHTRIKNSKFNVKGGSFIIDENNWQAFMQCYYVNVIQLGELEYMTEKQNIEDGPICVDFDFRYDSAVTTRQHNFETNIIEYLDVFLNELKKLIVFSNETFNIYVFEKDSVNVLAEEGFTKDGIHIIIGINIEHGLKTILRENFIKNIENADEQLPFTNSWSKIYDEGVCKGHTNWQMYGSCKPGHQQYKLTYMMEVVYDENMDEFETVQHEVPANDEMEFDMFLKLSVQYKGNPKMKISEYGSSQLNMVKNFPQKPSKMKIKYSKKSCEVDMFKVRNVEDLDKMVETFLDSLSLSDFGIKECHQYTMILPEMYYGEGSYDKWIRVGWALKSTDERLFVTWVKFSSQITNFNFDKIDELKAWWDGFDENGGLTRKSISYWAYEHANRSDYDKVKFQTIDHYINISVDPKTPVTEHDIACVIYQMYKEKYVCVCVKNNIWYEFINHRWVEINSGNSLRLSMSQEIYDLYFMKMNELTKSLSNNSMVNAQSSGESNHDLVSKKMADKARKFAEICGNLKKTQSKNNIFRETKELFYDNSFMKKQDQNSNLLCFKNGVYDFENCDFRDGKSNDYITKSTNIDYVPLEECNGATINEINSFMQQLFPVTELRNYMWQHLASTLIGMNDNQTFNIYTGSGRNGKSKLVELMTQSLGEYKGSVPVTLVTQSRRGIGQSSSEIVQLQGVRYAVMQEPSKGDKINEGIMKELTGGDPIQGRALFKDSVTFVPQFKLVVCTNTLFDITSNDEGTWRRIRVCDFMSKFKEKETITEDDEEPYQFEVDKKLDKKFPVWKTVFMAMLVDIVKTTKGNVTDCDIVLAKSGEYRHSQDYLAGYLKERLQQKNDADSYVTWSELYEDFKDWYTELFGNKIPKGQELKDFMTKKCGKPKRVLDGNVKKQAWIGWTLQCYEKDDNFMVN